MPSSALKLVKPPKRFPAFNGTLIERLAENMYHQYKLMEYDKRVICDEWVDFPAQDIWRQMARVAYVTMATEGGGVPEEIAEI